MSARICLSLVLVAPPAAWSWQSLQADEPSLGRAPINSATFSRDGKYVLTTSANHAQMWELETGNLIRRFEGHLERVHNAVFSPDRKLVLTCAGREHDMGVIPKDATARVWDVGSEVERQCFRHGGLVYAALFSPDGKYVLTVSKESVARVWQWDAENVKMLFRVPVHEGLAHSDRYLDLFAPASFSPDGGRILAKNRHGNYRVFIYDAKTGQELRNIDGHDKDIRSAVFSPSGKFVLTASVDGTARIWDAETGEMIREFKGHQGSVYSAMFQHDELRIVTASKDRTVRLWDTQSGKELRQFSHAGEVNYALISHDGSRILAKWEVVGREYRRKYHATLWDSNSGKAIKQFDFRPNSSIAIVTPDDQQVLVTLERTTLVDSQTGEVVREYP